MIAAVLAGLGACAAIVASMRSVRPVEAPLPSGLVAVNDPIDFGDIPQGTVKGTFELVNKISDTIHVA